MFLSDGTLRALITGCEIDVDPFDASRVQPCSLDLTLGGVDLPPEGATWWIPAGAFVLGSTVERIRLPSHIAATVSGKSTLGRLGLAVHVTAGHVDPGFNGQITLELVNHSSTEVALVQGQPIAQLVFSYLDQPSETPYRGRYQYQSGPTHARPPVAPSSQS